MTSIRIGLALGGGAARGLAHISMLQVFDELGLRPHRIAGTSMGALVGAAYASGLSADHIEAHAREVLGRRIDAARRAFSSGRGGVLDLLRFNPFNSPIIDGVQLVRLALPDGVAARLEDMQIPLKVVTCDFFGGRELVLHKGPTETAVAASIAIPGVISGPQAKHVLIDGGCVNPVPITLVQDDCDLVVGIDVIGRPVVREGRGPTTAELMAGSLQIQQRQIANFIRSRSRCDIYIIPDVDRFRVHEFFRLEEILDQAGTAREELKRQLSAAVETRIKRTG